MKSDFERNAFRMRYWLSAVFLFVTAEAVCFLVFGFSSEKLSIVAVVQVVCFAILFIICNQYINRVFCEIEQISATMIEVVEGSSEIATEEYKQGSIGILYTNFYKMVHSLRESQLKEKDEKIFLREIISDISHQLKTPLASLNIFIDLLLDDKVPDETKRKEMLVESKNQLGRMEWMVLSMLKLARIEAGAIIFERRKTSLNEVITQAFDGVRYLTDAKEKSLVAEGDLDAHLFCDGEWLTEAVINLLKNASDYSDMNTKISVKIEENDLYIRIYVKDEGMGIPEEELPNIFKRFYRVHQEVNPNSVGIGLSLTKSIVEGMGGRITVRSKEGEYTWFIMTFLK